MTVLRHSNSWCNGSFWSVRRRSNSWHDGLLWPPKRPAQVRTKEDRRPKEVCHFLSVAKERWLTAGWTESMQALKTVDKENPRAINHSCRDKERLWNKHYLKRQRTEQPRSLFFVIALLDNCVKETKMLFAVNALKELLLKPLPQCLPSTYPFFPRNTYQCLILHMTLTTCFR